MAAHSAHCMVSVLQSLKSRIPFGALLNGPKNVYDFLSYACSSFSPFKRMFYYRVAEAAAACVVCVFGVNILLLFLSQSLRYFPSVMHPSSWCLSLDLAESFEKSLIFLTKAYSYSLTTCAQWLLCRVIRYVFCLFSGVSFPTSSS